MDLGGPGRCHAGDLSGAGLRRASGRAIANALGRLAGDFHSGGIGRGMSGPVEIREERLVCITSSEPAGEHLADWPPSTPDQVHQLCDESPGVAASQSAIGPGSVRPTCASLRFRRSEAEARLRHGGG
jgi:hypothetical protein